ncbi:MAG: BlaI/MecI/CopY family transcriptional regulator [Verrucomicrobia bacterium]|nr:BlaI/MecI/CopY family transcriptional regulator [Verrucomicrobiota bacterium]
MPPKPTVHKLGDLQLQIMKVLWTNTEASVPEVHKALAEETELAYTTIATMLRKMEVKGLVKHRVEDRKFIYKPLVKEQEVSEKMSAHFVDRLFEGSLADMVSHLLSTHEVSREELVKIEKMVAARKKKL